MTARTKIIIAAVAFGLICIAAIIGAIINQANQPTSDQPRATGEQTTTYDPVTGEEIVETEGKAPEGLVEEGVLLLGFSKLSDLGMSLQQIEFAKIAIQDYATNDLEDARRISLDPNTLSQTVAADTGQVDITGDIVIDNETRQRATFSYVGYNDVLVRVYDKSTNEELCISAQDQH